MSEWMSPKMLKMTPEIFTLSSKNPQYFSKILIIFQKVKFSISLMSAAGLSVPNLVLSLPLLSSPDTMIYLPGRRQTCVESWGTNEENHIRDWSVRPSARRVYLREWRLTWQASVSVRIGAVHHSHRKKIMIIPNIGRPRQHQSIYFNHFPAGDNAACQVSKIVNE